METHLLGRTQLVYKTQTHHSAFSKFSWSAPLQTWLNRCALTSKQRSCFLVILGGRRKLLAQNVAVKKKNAERWGEAARGRLCGCCLEPATGLPCWGLAAHLPHAACWRFFELRPYDILQYMEKIHAAVNDRKEKIWSSTLGDQWQV